MRSACIRLALTSAAAVLGAAPLSAQPSCSPPSECQSPALDLATASAEENAQPTRGSVTVRGARINYTVTPGTLTIRDDEGKATASMFYVAYTADRPKDGRPRPITFLFNGGPGSSSMWLHMGSFGPVRVDTPTTDVAAPPPYRIAPNPESIIDRTDLVFLDAIGTGLSRPLGDTKGTAFWGVDQDIDAFTRGIERYVSKYDRWSSPKFLLGESYGTLRAAGLAHSLQNRGMQLNGVILLSTILNYGIRNPGFDQIYVSYLPSFAATAWYHNRIPDRPGTLEPFLTEVRNFARGPYLTALAQGDDLPDAERDAVARQLSAYTGISTDFLIKNDLRVDLGRFRKELLRDQRRTVGRLDSRFVGVDIDAAGDAPEYDAADTAISGAYIGALNSYLFGTLGYKTKLTYRPNYYSAISPAWDRTHKAPGQQQRMDSANTAIDLAQAMRQNPHLKVLALNGYYDMATPFGGAEYALKHMQLDRSLRDNLTFTYYPSGHMIYIEPGSMTALKRDLDSFYDGAAETAPK